MNGTGAAGRAAPDSVDVVVLGGGHAGIEAASAAARMGSTVALVTMDPAAIGRMSCNPAIGGTAKAHLVHEVDALGGVMGELADRTGIQFRILNRSKGPAVWSTRCQSDRDTYARCAREHVESLDAVRIVTGTIVAADRDAAGGVSAVLLDDGRRIACRALVIASGTFLDAVMYTGLEPTAGGRAGEAAAVGLGGWLARAGLVTHRLKTGTPPRLYRDSIDFSVCDEQPGDPDPQPFSGRTDRAFFPAMPQVSCHITHTTAATHEVLRTGFDRSPIFTGAIAGRGPRYCPSIEDKLVRFADRESHQLFIEPDGLDSDLIYLNGFSTSLPREVQAAALATIPGLERARVARPGYAVEYESVPAYQLGPTLETRAVPGLFLAGQVCGTSGYEEAAALGLMAGINAACRVQGRPPFTVGRSEAYIGVMIDDLTTREWREPYRMFTSRAEYRLLLRADNADLRLTQRGIDRGFVSAERARRFADKTARLDRARRLAQGLTMTPNGLAAHGLAVNPDGARRSALNLLRHPGIDLARLAAVWPELRGLDGDVAEQIEIEGCYAGYLDRQVADIRAFRNDEALKLPADLDYRAIGGLSNEVREKLAEARPATLAAAARISGVTPAALTALLQVVERRRAA